MVEIQKKQNNTLIISKEIGSRPHRRLITISTISKLPLSIKNKLTFYCNVPQEQPQKHIRAKYSFCERAKD